MNPHNWSYTKRIATTRLVTSTSLIGGFASSVDSAVIPQARIEFSTPTAVKALTTTNYLVGFGIGALFAALLVKLLDATQYELPQCSSS